MPRAFEIPDFYRSPIISALKGARRTSDPRKLEAAPSVLDLGRLRIKVARHFGFCFGVENAIEIAFSAIRDNPGKRIFLLSEMIHNPTVNADLISRGVTFLQGPDGQQLVPFETLRGDDIVIVPAFGTTQELFDMLSARGIDARAYNATCPFVEKVWKRAQDLSRRGFTVIIHGKRNHEETKATFSQASRHGPALVIRDMEEAARLVRYFGSGAPEEEFRREFGASCSKGFTPVKDLVRIGIVNQTTMLAGETEEISAFLKDVMDRVYGHEHLADHFADNRDTLCYATAENQRSVQALIASGGDLALVIGGYNSSNTSHLAALCERSVPTYHIKDCSDIIGNSRIRHRDLKVGEIVETEGWYPEGKEPVEILITAGASSPDSLVDECLLRIAAIFGYTDADLRESLKRALERA